MAKVLNPLMSQAAKGSIQGFTFQHSRGGYTARQKPIPPDRLRPGQPGNRALLSYLSSYWQGLNDTEKDSWKDWASTHPMPDGFGGTFLMSGFNAFIHLNQAMMSGFTGVAPEDKAPVIPLAATVATMTATPGIASGQIKVDFTLNGTGVAGDKVQIYLSTAHVGNGAYDSLSGYALKMSVAGNLVTATVTSLLPDAYYGVRVRYIQADGQRSNFLMAVAKALT